MLVIIRYWDQIKAVVGAAVNWIRGVWSAVTGAIGSAMSAAARRHRRAPGTGSRTPPGDRRFVRGLWSALTGFLGSAISGAMGAISGAWNRIEAIAKGVINTIRGAWDGLVGTIVGGSSARSRAPSTRSRAPINFVIDRWNDLASPAFDIISVKRSPGPIAGHQASAGAAGIPRTSAGWPRAASSPRPTLAMIGEAGPEAVIPLVGPGPRSRCASSSATPELRGMVRTEVVDQDTRTARTLLAGAH